MANAIIDPMDEEDYNKLKEILKQRGYSVEVANQEDTQFLDLINAEAIADQKGILHRGEIPSASAFYEECVHLIQNELFGVVDEYNIIEVEAREIAAAKHLLENSKFYKFTNDDYKDIDNNLKYWNDRYKSDTGEEYEESNINRSIANTVWEYFSDRN